MKTIYLKELRENARWAVLSMLLLLLLLLWAISEASTGASEPPIISPRRHPSGIGSFPDRAHPAEGPVNVPASAIDPLPRTYTNN